MHLYKLDEEGALHWIFAASKREACKILREHLQDCAYDDTEVTESMRTLAGGRMKLGDSMTYHADEGVETCTVRDWIAKHGKKAEYFACSEF